jgi:Ca-activated chloride channel family protein
MTGTLLTIAKDVKIQVEFNPLKVKSYRLIGYENRILKKEDFNNDKKDAGELGAGHTVTALYEIVPAYYSGGYRVDPLKYQKSEKAPSVLSKDALNSNEIMNVKLRYKEPDGDESKLIVVAVQDTKKALKESSTAFRFAAAVAGFGMILRGSEGIQRLTYDDVVTIARSAKGEDAQEYRSEFIKLVETCQLISKCN